MAGREEEGLKRRKKLEDMDVAVAVDVDVDVDVDEDVAEEPEASRLSIQARYFMASGEPRSMR